MSNPLLSGDISNPGKLREPLCYSRVDGGSYLSRDQIGIARPTGLSFEVHFAVASLTPQRTREMRNERWYEEAASRRHVQQRETEGI